jgi:hypothetical protein
MAAHRKTLVVALVVLVAALHFGACATEGGRASLLRDLKAGLAAARALAPGSRPEPPELVLDPLVGMSKAEILAALGHPTYCGESGDAECSTSSPWAYEWGPPPPAREEDKDGLVWVSAGGPDIVLLKFTNNVVASALWQGQR